MNKCLIYLKEIVNVEIFFHLVKMDMTIKKSLIYSLILALLFAIISSNKLYKLTAKLTGQKVEEVSFEGPSWVSYLMHIGVFFVLSVLVMYFGGKMFNKFLQKGNSMEK
jgi:uncharacterized protein involved in cysteine biosynthesis